MKKVTVTGGAGFIGSHLAKELARRGYHVIIDDLSTGKKENIAESIKKARVRFIQGSILDLHLLEQTFNGIDFVFHQAASPSVLRSVEDPLLTNQLNQYCHV